MRLFPNIKNMTAVKKGRGYVLGTLNERHDVFTYLQTDTLCLIAESVGAVFKAIDDQGWKPGRDRSSDNQGSDGEFNFFNSLAEAINMFRNKPRQVRKFKPAEDDLKATDSIGRDVEFDVTGDYIDVSRFLEGDPECFGVAVNGNPDGMRINIIYNANAVCNIKQSALNHKQARLLEVVDWFESRGVRCRIVSFASTQCAHIEVQVKAFEDVVNMNDLAIVGHSDFLRRVVFLIDEQSHTWAGGYGSPNLFSEIMANKYVADASDGLTIYIDDQSENDIKQIDKAFDAVKVKVADVISSPEKRDFSRVYMVQL